MAEPSTPAATATLYVNNINDKIAINKLKHVLTKLFGRYGPVLDVDARKTLAMKGQAFVTYKEAGLCEKAMHKLEGYRMFKQPIHIAYANTDSDAYNKLKGDTEKMETRVELKRKREAEKEALREQRLLLAEPKQMSKAQISQWRLLPPHNVLLLQNLEASLLDTGAVETAFSAHAGFERVRVIKFRKLAFVDFDSETLATACLASISESQFGPGALLSYAKK